MRLKISIILAVLLALILGILLGRILRITRSPATPLVVREDRRPLTPIVRITGAEDGNILGTALGNVRVFFGEHLIIPGASGAFRVPARELLKNVATISLPAGMQFVASKRGKKYYPVASRSAQNLAPGNRIYFGNAEAAEAAGYAK